MHAAQPKITVILNAHHEGRLAHHSLQSARRSMDHAEKHGVSCELLAVLDAPDDATTDYFERHQHLFSGIETTGYRDLGLARNHGARQARGEWLAFLDADDLFGQNWLTEAYRTAERIGPKAVIHPAWLIAFGNGYLIQRHVEWPSAEWSAPDMLEHNCWTALCLCPRNLVADEIPFRPNDLHTGFGYEDWHWHCETMARGVQHRVATETVHFIRRKAAGSLLQASRAQNCLTRPSHLFDGDVVDLWAGESPPPRPGRLRRLNPLNWRVHHLGHWVGMREIVHQLIERIPPPSREAALTLLGELRKSVRRAPRPPGWLLKEWQAIHALEPQLYPSSAAMRRLQVWHTPRSALGRRYPRIDELFGRSVDYVFLLSWLKRGGCDLESLYYMRAVAAEQPEANIVCVLTEHADHPWLSRLPKNIRVVELGRELGDFPRFEQVTLLARLLLQKSPRVIHLVNSPTGYELFLRYGRQLASRSRLFVSVFCADYDAAGRAVGYVVDQLPQCADAVAGIFSDNERTLEEMRSSFGIPAEKLHAVYVPGPEPSASSRRRQDTLRVLWAGRLDRQKRPDILYRIAAALVNGQFQFDVFGTAEFGRWGKGQLRQLKRLPNLVLRGGYDGFASLPASQYDVFLYTSQWDGLPNVLLEAIAAGLPVIAPDVGGISELIDTETGYLVSGAEAVDEYVAALRAVAAAPEAAVQKAAAAAHLVSERHSWANFIARLRGVPGYLEAVPQLLVEGPS